MATNVKYTQMAAKALNLAELFEASFAAGLRGPVHYKIQLAAPDGPSTGGGKQAVQHIKLVPADGGPTAVIGSANTTTQRAEIRTYELVIEQHARRFKGARMPIDIRAYRELMLMLSNFFTSMRMTVSLEDAAMQPAASAEPAQGEGGRSQLVVVVLLGVGLLVLTALVFYFQGRA